MKTIFLVTVLSDKKIDRQRTWGWFTTLGEAKRAILSNAIDMFECNYYNLAVIEEMPSGMIPCAKKEIWFQAEYPPHALKPSSKLNVFEIEKPNKFEHVVNFGIG